MATQQDYSAVANALVADIVNLINNGIPGTTFTGVPDLFKGDIPPGIENAAAGLFAKTAVDTLDAFRAKGNP